VLAAQLFPDEEAVGRPLTVVADAKTIVGVVRATRHFGPDTDAPAEIYAPYSQDPWAYGQIVAQGTSERVAAAVAAAAAEVDPELGLPPVAPYERFLTDWFSALRLQLVVVGILAVIGTGLATLGLYALVAYRVNMRRREIGVRMALGASDSTMFASVVGQGVSLAAFGVVLGVGLWYALIPVSARVLGSGDLSYPLASVAVAVLVATVAAAASAIPARRSVRVDPAVTLRSE